MEMGAKSRFNLELHSFRCNCIAGLANTFTCNMSRLAPNRYSLSGLVELHRPMHPNAEIAIYVHYKLPTANRRIKFMDLRLKLCDVMSSVQRMPVVRNILVEIRRSSNFPLTCPFKEHVMYNLSNMIITNEIIPPYVPHHHVNVSLQFYEQQLQIAYYNVSGSVIPKSIKG
ncbi:uncharacterized protein LOC131997980 [Stomoxys calcitrans]|uniref:uncharacterized protein LOC131997980 n=1 Tax=Stomoxys calcitrans TaxID=35570 RepID=UPI0027E2BD04|nr:uncharacterized protein LOC131997980 [Stomoxys calcitrans]